MDARFIRRTAAMAGLGAAGLSLCVGAVAVGPAEAATGSVARVALANPLPSQGLPHDWVKRGRGYFRTADPQDLLHYRVVPNAAALDAVTFRLEGGDRCLWWKTLVMPDGEGSTWDITIDPSRGRFAAENSLWAHQVRNGQRLGLWKAGVFAGPSKVLEIGDLGDLQPGTKVVFTWLKDSSTCGA